MVIIMNKANAKVEPKVDAEVKVLSKKYVAVHQIVRAVKSKNEGKTEFETIEPGQRFGATQTEIDDLPANSYKDYKAPPKSADSDDIELDENFEPPANNELVVLDPVTGLPVVPPAEPHDDV